LHCLCTRSWFQPARQRVSRWEAGTHKGPPQRCDGDLGDHIPRDLSREGSESHRDLGWGLLEPERPLS